METLVLDFSKLKCKEHPLDLITNFCLNDKCMIGLCAQCICDHTDMHIRDRSNPAYKPVKQLHNIVHQEINNCIKMLESDKDRIMAVMKNILDRKQLYKNILTQAKQDVLHIVERVFQEAASRFQHQVKEEEKKTGLHSNYQMELLCKKINRQINHLINQAHQLNSIKFLDMIKTVKQSALKDVSTLRSQIKSQIQQNQQFVSSLVYKRQQLIGIQLSIKQLFSNSFSYPKMKCNIRENSMTETSRPNSRGRPQSPRAQITIMPMPFQKTPSTNIRSSLIFEQNRIKQCQKHERSSSNFMLRNGSHTGVTFIPQYIDFTNLPLEMDKRMASTAGSTSFKLSGSRVFQITSKQNTGQVRIR